MAFWQLTVDNIARTGTFPFQVCRIFYCNDLFIPNRVTSYQDFEICIRLQTNSLTTEDVIDGKSLKLTSPNVICRFPGSEHEQKSPGLRDVISFAYPPETAEALKKLGMLPQQNGWNLVMSAELSGLVVKFRNTASHLYTPGMADVLDWTCFCLLGEVMLQAKSKECITLEKRILNISLWFQMHLTESINVDEVAKANGMSHSYFFHMWEKYFSVSPVQYIINLRLEAAARDLRETSYPVCQIIQSVHFSGEYAFYRKFYRKYGMTPAEYRKMHRKKAAPTA